MCGCTSGSSGSRPSPNQRGWNNPGRLRYAVVKDGFSVTYGSLRDAERHVKARGGRIETIKPGQTRKKVVR